MRTRNCLLALSVDGAALVQPAVPTMAEPTDRFGAHVRNCAQSEGLSGDHKPGIHDGATGWDGLPCQ